MKLLLLITMILISMQCLAQKSSSGIMATVDSTKKQPQMFYIIGAQKDFEVVLKCIIYPEKATREEIAFASQWVASRAKLVTDTTSKKPKQ